MAARELGGRSLDDALKLCVMLAKRDAPRFERAALRWLERFIEERLPSIAEVALAATALAELRQRCPRCGTREPFEARCSPPRLICVGRAKRLAKRSTRV